MANIIEKHGADGFDLRALMDKFEDHDVAVLQVRGRTAMLVQDVGRALGYGNDGKKLALMIRQEWSQHFVEGQHFEVLRGENRKDLLDLLELTPCHGVSSLKHAPALTVLYEPGFWAVLDNSNKPEGVRFKRWLTTEGMPKLARGEPVALPGTEGVAPAVEKTASAMKVPVWDMPGLSPRDAAIHRRFTAKLLRDVAHLPTVVGAQRQALMVRAAEVASGVPMTNALPAPDPEPEWTTEQLMEMFRDEFGFSSNASTLGRIASTAGITTEPVDPHLVRKMRQQRKGGSFQDCPGWAYTAAGVEVLREAARAWQEKYNAKKAAKEARAAEREAKRAAKAAGKSDIERARASRETPPALPGLDHAEGDQ